MKLSKLHYKIYGEKLVELANMAFVGLVLAQFLSEQFKPEMATFGLVITSLCYLISYLLLGEVRN